MREKELKEIFDSKIENDEFISLPNNATVLLPEFIKRFKGVKENPSYDDFIKVDGYVDKNQQGMGYKTFFDKCKEEGILK